MCGLDAATNVATSNAHVHRHAHVHIGGNGIPLICDIMHWIDSAKLPSIVMIGILLADECIRLGLNERNPSFD